MKNLKFNREAINRFILNGLIFSLIITPIIPAEELKMQEIKNQKKMIAKSNDLKTDNDIIDTKSYNALKDYILVKTYNQYTDITNLDILIKKEDGYIQFNDYYKIGGDNENISIQSNLGPLYNNLSKTQIKMILDDNGNIDKLKLNDILTELRLNDKNNQPKK